MRKYKEFTEEDFNLISELRNRKITFNEIKSKYYPDHSIDCITNFCKKRKIVKTKEKWSKDEILILKDGVLNNLSFHEISKNLPKRSYSTVVKYASDHKIRNFRIGRSKQYQSDDEFWNEINYNNSYWSGFIAADGNVFRIKESLLLSISLKGDDRQMLETFLKCINSNYPIRNFTLKNGKEYCSIAVRNKNWINSKLMNEFGIIPRKTQCLPSPILNDKYFEHYIAGFIDGDGSYSISKDKFIIQIGCFVPNVLERIKDFSLRFKQKAKRKDRKVRYYKNKNNGIFIFSVGGYPAIQMAHYLMSLPCPHLKRKYDIVRNFLISNPKYNLSLPPYEEKMKSIEF